jgi:CRISPR/Cas system CSM-associated protein Csm2 small subunit
MPDMSGAFKKVGLTGSEDKCPTCGRRKRPGHKLCFDCSKKERESQSACVFPSGYPNYFTDKGVIKEEYVTTLADSIAQEFGYAKLTMHQLRSFYQYVKQREAAIQHEGSLDRVIADIKRLKSFAHERANKDKIPRVFKDFIDRNVDKVVDRKTLIQGFAEHFQAVVAYSAGRVSHREGFR